MNIVTKTFDEAKWQIVPKEATKNMMDVGGITVAAFLNRPQCHEDKSFVRNIHRALLAAAPHPEELSPWLPIESAPKDGLFLAYCGKMTDSICSQYPDPYMMIIHGKTYWQCMSADAKPYMPIEDCKAARFWTPLPHQLPPEVEK